MREIKFRGLGELQSKWYEGDFITDVGEFNRSCDKAYILPHWDKLNCPIQVHLNSVGQYSGLKDIRGHEIYEGDILKTHNQNNIVKYEYSSFMLVGLHEDTYERTYAHLKDYLVDMTIPGVEGSSYDGVTIKLEIIGNIYENKELLEVEQ